jgi:hypothetical protein
VLLWAQCVLLCGRGVGLAVGRSAGPGFETCCVAGLWSLFKSMTGWVWLQQVRC